MVVCSTNNCTSGDTKSKSFPLPNVHTLSASGSTARRRTRTRRPPPPRGHGARPPPARPSRSPHARGHGARSTLHAAQAHTRESNEMCTLQGTLHTGTRACYSKIEYSAPQFAHAVTRDRSPPAEAVRHREPNTAASQPATAISVSLSSFDTYTWRRPGQT